MERTFQDTFKEQLSSTNEKTILNTQHSLNNFDLTIQITTILGSNISSGIGAAVYAAIVSSICAIIDLRFLTLSRTY